MDVPVVLAGVEPVACFQQWCASCGQGVEQATPTSQAGVFYFEPCGHTARFYENLADRAHCLVHLRYYAGCIDCYYVAITGQLPPR